MKALTSILVGSVALALAGTASADVIVHMTGSTAFRPQAHLAIAKILGGTPLTAYSGSSLPGANQAWFKGTVAGVPGNVIIKTSWSGAVGGVQTVSQGINVNFLADSQPSAAAATIVSNVLGGGVSVSAGTVAEVPEVAMADNYQGTTVFSTPTLTDKKVGIVPFKWVVNSGGTAPFDNITPQQAQALWFSVVGVPKSMFTGVSTDTATVYPAGRDPDSGTRLTAFAESGIGVNNPVYQYRPTVSNGAVTGYSPEAAVTVNGIFFDQGNGGFSSGGSLATAMKATTSDATGYAVTYLSTGDAATALAGSAKELKYNGVAYSLTAVIEGQYTFWAYEHLMYKTTLGTSNPDAKTVADTIATQIKTTDAVIKLGDMMVGRQGDGGLVTVGAILN